MDEFGRRARARFAGAPQDQQAGGSELLIAYVLPDDQMVYGGRPVVGYLSCPDFDFEEIPRGSGDQSAPGPSYPPIGRSWKS